MPPPAPSAEPSSTTASVAPSGANTPDNTAHSQITHATAAFARFLNDDIPGAISDLESDPKSPFHLVGRGFIALISAALSMESGSTDQALNMLSAAEKRARAVKQEGVATGGRKHDHWLPAGIDQDLLCADSDICQAMLLMSCETYMQYAKGLLRIKSAYTTFSTAGKTLFGDSTTPDCTVQSLVEHLNKAYLAHSTSPSAPPAGPVSAVRGSWLLGRFAGRSNSALGTIPTLKAAAHEKLSTKSAPGSGTATPAISELEDDGPRRSLALDTKRTIINGDGSEPPPSAFDSTHATPLWIGNVKTNLIISAAAFGYGSFSLMLSLIPPKFRSVLSWVGLKGLPRREALKVLSISALCGSETHAWFSALALLSYYGTVLPSSGWLVDEASVLTQMTRMLDQVEGKFPDGTLWIFNRVKLARMRRNPALAYEILQRRLAQPSVFKQGRTILYFELCWVLVAERRFDEAAKAFDEMRGMNDWSPSTYLFCAAGCLIELLQEQRLKAGEKSSDEEEIEKRIRHFLEETPKLMGKKKVMGNLPPTETFVKRKLAFYSEKHARWVAQGRLKGRAAESTEVWRVIKISPAQEFSLIWNAHQRCPLSSLQATVDSLLALSPAIDAPRASNSAPPSRRHSEEHPDLDTGDELALRDLMLGTMYRNLRQYELARKRLQAVLDAELAGVIKSDTYVPAMAHYELAVLDCWVAGEEAKKEKKTDGAAKIWQKRFESAEAHIVLMGKREDFDLSQRLYTRSMVLEGEMDEKRRQLGLTK